MNKRSRTSKKSERKIIEACQLIDKVIENEELKRVYLDYFKEYIYTLNLRMVSIATYNCIACLILCINISDLSINSFDWNLLCKIYNLNYKEEVIRSQDFFSNTEFSDDIKIIVEKYQDNSIAVGWIQFYNSVISFYQYLAKLKEYYCYANIKEILNFKELLGIFNTITIKDIKDEENYNTLRRTIISNYPEGSNYHNIVKVEYTNLPDINKKRFTNVNINTNNYTSKMLIKDFFRYYSKRGQVTDYIFKCFMCYWNDSIGEHKIINYNDFTEELFLKQYKYYAEQEEFFRFNGELKSNKQSFLGILVYIYRYIIEESLKKNMMSYKNSFIIAVNSKYYNKIFGEGYKPIFFNRSELPIDDNKICILPSEYTMNNSHSNNTVIRFIDFDKVPQKYVGDVKKFIWNYKGQVNEVIRKIHYIFELLCEREMYTSKAFNTYSIEEDKEFSEEFLYEFRFKMENKYKNKSTLKSVYKMIRKYLRYYFEKYKVDSYDIEVFNLIGLDENVGGKPITEKDIDLIYRAFIQNEKDSDFYKLYTIAFEIFLNTNLRIGEILNLKRNCIIHKNLIDTNGTICYLSKVSNEEILEKKVDIKIINLLEEAIRITSDIDTNSIVNDYIFVEPMLRKVSPSWKRISFGPAFCKIVNKLGDQLDNTNYVPYNIRHSFINNAYKVGTKLEYSIAQIAAVTGNSFATAIKHYRDYHDIDNYIEALSKVTISNVNIHGKILSKYDYEENRYVRGELGVCLEQNCSFEIAECLICNYFATFPSRIPIFEEFIKYLNNEIENNYNIYYIDELHSIKKIAAKYLAELYKIQL